MDEIRVENEGETLRFIVGINIYVDDLSRRNKNKGPVLVVVSVTTIFDISTLHIFQVNRIKTEIHPGSIELRRFPRKVYDAYQRMQVLLVIESIMFAHCIDPQDILHVFDVCSYQN